MNQRRKQVPFILNSDACESHNTLMFMPQRKAMSLTFFVKKILNMHLLLISRSVQIQLFV